MQFKALCDNGYYLCGDEYHLYEEWEELTRARPRYISIMDGLIAEDDKQEMNDEQILTMMEHTKIAARHFFWHIIS